MVMGFDFEGYGVVVSDIDYSGIFSRALKDSAATCR
jgi:hypothetical protein